MNTNPPPSTANSRRTGCPNCGASLPDGVLSGLCPLCLLGTGAETEGPAGAGMRFVPPGVDALAALFPRLEIRELLGAGGMGAVYRARQPDLDRWVALKILPAGSDAGPASAERFNREARALARLSHPNIVAVFEFGQVPGYHFFLMEFVDGANLRQLVRQGRVSGKEALRIVPQICDALQYAHDQGVVHRDIKPENVLLDRQGRIKIADFGLARILGTGGEGERERLTIEGQVIGTPHYMAPEQVERPLSVDHRADLFSLGVVFYELLTGELPLGKFPPPSTKRITVDVRLDAIVLRALENDPERRYQHASEIKSRVETIRDDSAMAGAGEPEAGRPSGGPSPDEDPGKPDWREWIPFQSAEAREIYRHYTPEERREDLRLGARYVLPFLGVSVLAMGLFAALIDSHRPGLALIVGLAYAAFAASATERFGAISRRFLASTAWARRRGWDRDTVRLFSPLPYESARSIRWLKRVLVAAAVVAGTVGLLFAARNLIRVSTVRPSPSVVVASDAARAATGSGPVDGSSTGAEESVR
ncbi:MAG: serine/threonine protein kinase, partial [Verrucomicrobiales bacterium]|nr:serine/threonine protein kinase [Verrucomicrobiales bacterium]